MLIGIIIAIILTILLLDSQTNILSNIFSKSSVEADVGSIKQTATSLDTLNTNYSVRNGGVYATDLQTLKDSGALTRDITLPSYMSESDITLSDDGSISFANVSGPVCVELADVEDVSSIPATLTDNESGCFGDDTSGFEYKY
tara:strand:+ start:372 stop:800 length:429 start_codon:yes stop_codon:yes gene_type:complete